MCSLKPDVFFGELITERYQLADKVLGHGAFGFAFLCFDLEEEDIEHESSKTKRAHCIAKIEIEPTTSCFYKDQTQLEHEYTIYSHLQQYPKLQTFLPKVHLFTKHYLQDNPTSYPCLILERVGIDLFALAIQEEIGYFSVPVLARFGIQVLDALQCIHAMFIAHRDIKPQNIMMCREFKQDGTPYCQIKLIDFGLSIPIPTEDQVPDSERYRFRSSACTLAFGSWRQHFKHVCSARTDLESFIYSWVFLSGADLPWRHVNEKMSKSKLRGHIGRMKIQVSGSQICTQFDVYGSEPKTRMTLSKAFKKIRELKFAQQPNYNELRQYFKWLEVQDSN